jgi:hypothetical protein
MDKEGEGGFKSTRCPVVYIWGRIWGSPHPRVEKAKELVTRDEENGKLSMDSALDHYDASACSDAMHSRSPHRRPRVRKSRGRGLRTTNGWWVICLSGASACAYLTRCSITCRKRHLKCDEVKPICGACAKNNKICEFAGSGRRSVNLPASDGAVTEAVPDLSAQQRAVAVEDNERESSTARTNFALSELREATVPGWPSFAVDLNLSQPAQLDQLTRSQSESNQKLVASTDASLSPSNSSLAAVRWFGLLANDAAKDSSQVSTIHDSWVNQGFSLQDHSNAEGQTQLSSLQCATLVLDGPSSIYASHDPTQAGTSVGNTVGDEQIWQSREPIELLSGEETLFEHFVTRVSPWVCTICHA